MFRKASLIVVSIALVASVRYRPSACTAWDDVKMVPPKDAEKKKADTKELEKFDKVEIGEIEDAPPAALDVDPTLEKPGRPAQEAEYNDDSKLSEQPGRKPSSGFGTRGSGSRAKMLASGGGTKQSERAVTAALVWLANHQSLDGSWSLKLYTRRCVDKTCTGVSDIPADAGATAMGLLPFLAAGQTHKSKGPYKEHILKGVGWLIKHQQPDGNLGKGAQQMMYSHGLATIAISEAYGLTGDKQVGRAAQAAVNFILKAQNAADGGWRYNPGDAGDTSVLGWQLMALKSAHMAGLDVGGTAFSGASKWLDSVAVNNGSEYSYQPGTPPANTMTSVGLLCRQYLGAKHDSPMLAGGAKYLMNHLPDESMPNIYYWYYATQVMHNMGGTEWDAWNGKMRDLLVRTQARNVDQCANGSWAPEKDVWGMRGSRVMTTSLSALTLEIYYRYLPLFSRK